MIARVSMSLKSRTSPDIFPFCLYNKKRLAIRHMNRPLFPTTLSIPSYDIGKYVELRTYQHPLLLSQGWPDTLKDTKDSRSSRPRFELGTFRLPPENDI